MSDHEATVEVVRGSDTQNREKFRTTVSADSLEELDEKVRALREQVESWAQEFRQIQPKSKRRVSDDQSELGEVRA